jgi:hypothetical protein
LVDNKIEVEIKLSNDHRPHGNTIHLGLSIASNNTTGRIMNRGIVSKSNDVKNIIDFQ